MFVSIGERHVVLGIEYLKLLHGAKVAKNITIL